MHIMSLLLYSIVAVYVMCFCCCLIAENIGGRNGPQWKGPHLRVLSNFYPEYTVQSFHII